MSAASLRESLVVGGWSVLDHFPGRAVLSRRSRLVRAGSEVLLTLLALAGVGVAILTLVLSHAGVRPLVVRSGSMEPFIRTGSMVLVQRVEASQLRVGDVVTVPVPGGGQITHRVVSVAPAAGGATRLETKGDANKAVDAWPSTVRRAERLVWRAPVVGRLAAWLATARGGFALGCMVTLLVYRARRPRARA